MTLSLAVLLSGAGTNLQALLDAIAAGRLDARVTLVLCDRLDAGGLARAEAAMIPTLALPRRDFPDRQAFDRALSAALQEARPDWVVSAGFMRILGGPVLEAFPDRVLNIHPSLLPAFPGLRAPAQAVAAGVRLSGATLHLVDAGVDTGPILAQAAVPVLPQDSPEALHARIQREEHRLLPAALQAIAEGRLQQAEGRWALDLPAPTGALCSPQL